MTKKVTLDVDPYGRTKVSAEGYEGGTCIDATSAFETLFKKTVVERKATGECDVRRDDGERVRY